MTTPKAPAPERDHHGKKVPGKAIAKVTGPKPMTTKQAEAITAKIKTGTVNLMELVVRAFEGRVWVSMGHKGWDEYLDAELGGAPLSLPREKRKEAVKSLHDRGLSTRAIAAATGVDQKTAHNDIQEKKADAVTVTEEKFLSDDDEIPTVDAEFVDDEPPLPKAKVTGIDGREQPATKPPRTSQKSSTQIAVETAKKLAKEISSIATRLTKLYDSDEYKGNEVVVDAALEVALSDFVDAVDRPVPTAEAVS